MGVMTAKGAGLRGDYGPNPAHPSKFAQDVRRDIERDGVRPTATPTDSKPAVADTHGLTLNGYQESAHETAIYPDAGTGSANALSYLMLQLNSEAGEVAGKLAKIFRDKDGRGLPEDRLEILKELGDVMWYVAMIANELNSSLADVAQTNLDKLASRAGRNALGGSGDNR